MKSGGSDKSSGELFQEHILGNLKSLLDHSPETQVYLIPSTRDMLSNHIVFPQSDVMSFPDTHVSFQMSRINQTSLSMSAAHTDTAQSMSF